jgi:molybdopterin-guanine dinucleotide biosynthesis protein A
MMRTLVIQAGGESLRMGQNKARMLFCGEPLIERILRRTGSLAGQVFITTNLPEQLEYLGLPVVEDIIPGKGALGGLYTALATAANSEVIVVACDMPFVNPDLILAECDLLLTGQTDAVIPVSPLGFEPFHAVYRRESCLAAVQKVLQAGQLRLSSWFSEVHVYKMTLAEVAQYDPNYYAFINVNTPEEFQIAERLARQIGQV